MQFVYCVESCQISRFNRAFFSQNFYLCVLVTSSLDMVATDSDQDSCCARYCLYTVRANCIIKDNKYFTINQIFEALFRFELKPIDYKSIRLTIDPIEPTRINSRYGPYGLPPILSAPLPQALLALIS